MPTSLQAIKMLQALVEQTRLGNARWERLDSPTQTYSWVAGEAAIVLRAANEAGRYPVTLEVWSLGNDAPTYSWNTHETSNAEEVQWDELVRELWSLVSEVDDPVITLLRHLDSMPPF
jgi:hypothetical protein